ncbi:MAG: DUF72 domain-containing protein [Bacteroidia bacterium]
MTKRIYRIGCSGYYYPSWKNIFYPKGLPAKEWLKYYSFFFNTVELNGTFYKVPQLSALKRYQAATPDNFKFSVKMNKFITHNKKLNDCKEEITKFQDLVCDGLGDKLGCFLFQMPPSFHFTEENLERVLTNVPHLPRNVVELRHVSWWNDVVFKSFKKAKITFCNVDFPGLKSYIVDTSPVFYFRFHGNPVLFTSQYELSVLKKYAKEFPQKSKEHYLYFNNTSGNSGLTNAKQLKEIIKNE